MFGSDIVGQIEFLNLHLNSAFPARSVLCVGPVDLVGWLDSAATRALNAAETRTQLVYFTTQLLSRMVDSAYSDCEGIPDAGVRAGVQDTLVQAHVLLQAIETDFRGIRKPTEAQDTAAVRRLRLVQEAVPAKRLRKLVKALVGVLPQQDEEPGPDEDTPPPDGDGGGQDVYGEGVALRPELNETELAVLQWLDKVGKAVHWTQMTSPFGQDEASVRKAGSALKKRHRFAASAPVKKHIITPAGRAFSSQAWPKGRRA